MFGILNSKITEREIIAMLEPESNKALIGTSILSRPTLCKIHLKMGRGPEKGTKDLTVKSDFLIRPSL